MFAHFQEYHRNGEKNLRARFCMVLGEAVTKLQRSVWIFNQVSRVIP